MERLFNFYRAFKDEESRAGPDTPEALPPEEHGGTLTETYLHRELHPGDIPAPPKAEHGRTLNVEPIFPKSDSPPADIGDLWQYH